eukprot:TRINITY_DN8597_c0_g1_i4.p1 TRINITY_DN8597_c0_g1~~TRINITY_DN8597_c0_g1_i4.p1  ORF type:complete len:622 (-),score=65.10 TRINITY_DN8597_c0_g1_i4:612-2249(-)
MGTQRGCTRTAGSRSANPQWHEEVALQAELGSNVAELTVTTRKGLDSEELGSCSLDLLICFVTGETDLWLPLQTQRPQSPQPRLHVQLAFPPGFCTSSPENCILRVTVGSLIRGYPIKKQPGAVLQCVRLQMQDDSGKALGPPVTTVTRNTGTDVDTWWNDSFFFFVGKGASCIQAVLLDAKQTQQGQIRIPLLDVPVGRELTHAFRIHDKKKLFVTLGFLRISPQTGAAAGVSEYTYSLDSGDEEERDTQHQLELFGCCGALRVSYFVYPPTSVWPGLVVVDVLDAHDLTSVSLLKPDSVPVPLPPDTYVSVTCGNHKPRHTGTAFHTYAPCWNARFTFSIAPHLCPPPLHFKLVESGFYLFADAPAGTCCIPLARSPAGNAQVVECRLATCVSNRRCAENPVRALREKGYVPAHPIVLVPGFASSGLIIQRSTIPGWEGQRVWLSLTKIGTIRAQSLYRAMSHWWRGNEEPAACTRGEEAAACTRGKEAQDREREKKEWLEGAGCGSQFESFADAWTAHMSLDADGWCVLKLLRLHSNFPRKP